MRYLIDTNVILMHAKYLDIITVTFVLGIFWPSLSSKSLDDATASPTFFEFNENQNLPDAKRHDNYVQVLRGNQYAQAIEELYQLTAGQHECYVATITLGELDAAAKKSGYSARKIERINRFIARTNILGIDTQQIIEAYGDVDAFSQGKTTLTPQDFAPRNMGKNDIWLAAIAHVYKLTLLTTDKDFVHLAGSLIDLE